MPVMQTMPPLGFAHLSESSSDVVPISSRTCSVRSRTRVRARAYRKGKGGTQRVSNELALLRLAP